MAEPVPDDNMEPQTAGFIPGYNVEGDYPAYCHRYTTDAGNEHVEMCGRHAEVAMDNTLPGVEKWTKALNELYDEWLDNVRRRGSSRRGFLSGVFQALAGAAGDRV